METIISKTTNQQLNSDIIKKAGDILRNGGLVAFPTETVYGLGADALNENAAKKIYAAKGRPSDNPLIVHITNMEALKKIVSDIPAAARIVARRYWPGPLTMIFNKSSVVPYGTTGGLNTVAVRMPSHDIACAVIEAGGGYIAAPSANTSGRPSPTTAEHVKEDLKGKIDMIVDGGPVEIGVESTILDMSVTPPMILRPGAITKEMLEELLGEVEVDTALLDEDSKKAPKAPGMKYRHYAPKAKLCVVEGDEAAVIEEINRTVDEKMREGKKVGIIGTQETIDRYPNGVVKCIGTRRDEATVANHLYAVLREFDEEDVDCILSEAFSGNGIGDAVMNRLLKAAGYHIIQVQKEEKLFRKHEQGECQMGDKRADYISWDEYFMGVALLSGMRSKDPNTQVGCCIVSQDNKILSMGYNGLPTGCSDDHFPWTREGDDPLETKYFYTVHSELNAILNYRGGSLEGAKLYVSLFPCNECAKAIIQSGIKEVIYGSNKYEDTPSVKASMRMFDASGVNYHEYHSTKREIKINL